GTPRVRIEGAEMVTHLVGTALCFLVWLAWRRASALDFGVGFALSSAGALLTVSPESNSLVVLTFLGALSWYSMLGISLLVASEGLRRAKSSVRSLWYLKPPQPRQCLGRTRRGRCRND